MTRFSVGDRVVYDGPDWDPAEDEEWQRRRILPSVVVHVATREPAGMVSEQEQHVGSVVVGDLPGAWWGVSGQYLKLLARAEYAAPGDGSRPGHRAAARAGLEQARKWADGAGTEMGDAAVVTALNALTEATLAQSAVQPPRSESLGVSELVAALRRQDPSLAVQWVPDDDLLAELRSRWKALRRGSSTILLTDGEFLTREEMT